MKALGRIILFGSILIGTIGFAMILVFGSNATTYIIHDNINGIDILKISTWNYIEGIRQNLTNPTELNLQLPELQWRNDISFDNWPFVFANNAKVMVNYLIIVANILLYPIRLGAYAQRTIFTILGLNMNINTTPMTWLVQLINDAISLSIPYLT